jgi:hypothetical protein
VFSLALVLPTTAIAESSVTVKAVSFKDIAIYPE